MRLESGNRGNTRKIFRPRRVCVLRLRTRVCSDSVRGRTVRQKAAGCLNGRDLGLPVEGTDDVFFFLGERIPRLCLLCFRTDEDVLRAEGNTITMLPVGGTRIAAVAAFGGTRILAGSVAAITARGLSSPILSVFVSHRKGRTCLHRRRREPRSSPVLELRL